MKTKKIKAMQLKQNDTILIDTHYITVSHVLVQFKYDRVTITGYNEIYGEINKGFQLGDEVEILEKEIR